VPRHREIDFLLARKICSGLGIPPPSRHPANRPATTAAFLDCGDPRDVRDRFDYGDEWRLLLLDITDDWPAGDESYPMLVEAEGTPPPQYQPLDEDDE
jgi:hypothetical protein